MAASTSARRCALLWLLLGLLPLAVLLGAGIPWWQQLRALDDQLETDRAQLTRYQRLVATLPALREELAREQADDAFKAFYFDAETPALAGAQLQRELQEMVRSSGGRPVSAQILPVDEEEKPQRVRVRIQLQGSTEQLFDLLFRIEEARPFLFVDQMSIRSMSGRRRAVRRRSVASRGGGASDAVTDELTVRLDVFGYTLGKGG